MLACCPDPHRIRLLLFYTIIGEGDKQCILVKLSKHTKFGWQQLIIHIMAQRRLVLCFGCNKKTSTTARDTAANVMTKEYHLMRYV